MSLLHKKIIVDGRMIGNEKDFVDKVGQSLGLQRSINLISELKGYFTEYRSKITIIWRNSKVSNELMVRKSDVPIDELPKDGSLMQRDIILNLIWEKQSLVDKAKALLNDLKNVELVMK